MEIAFKKGDIVVLKSGGPPMTVDVIPGGGHGQSYVDDKEYLCRWFRDAVADQGTFGEHLLERFTAAKDA